MSLSLGNISGNTLFPASWFADGVLKRKDTCTGSSYLMRRFWHGFNTIWGRVQTVTQRLRRPLMNTPKHLVLTAFPSFRTSGTHNSFVNVRAGSRGGAAGSPEDPEAPGEIVRIGRLPALGLRFEPGK